MNRYRMLIGGERVESVGGDVAAGYRSIDGGDYRGGAGGAARRTWTGR